MDAKSWSTT